MKISKIDLNCFDNNNQSCLHYSVAYVKMSHRKCCLHKITFIAVENCCMTLFAYSSVTVFATFE